MALVRVFLSHKQQDAAVALRVANELSKKPDIEAYVDVLDAQLTKSAEDLTDHLRRRLGECTHLMVVVSDRTRESWWVPFEIGLATEKTYPIATLAMDTAPLPEYLRKWPYLRTPHDLDTYIRVALATQPAILRKGLREAMQFEQRQYAVEFHRALRGELGQR